MENSSCFLCAEDCSNSNLCLINLETKKHKSKYPILIGNLIKSEYELRISKSDKICSPCQAILEKYDELEREARVLKNVLSRQIAHTYNIETDAEEVYLDKSKIFTEVRSNGSSDNSQKYSCKQCPRYVTDNLDTVNAHIIYHQITAEEVKANNTVKILAQTPSAASSSSSSKAKNTREVQKSVKTTNLKTANSVNNAAAEISHVPPTTAPVQFQLANNSGSGGAMGQEMSEETLDSLIDLKLLDDEFYDSNLIKHNCHLESCKESFTYACDYVRHLKLKHKSTLNNILLAVKANLKRPTEMSRFACPYCFTTTSSVESLEQHVKQHELAPKTGHLTERLSDFVSSMMKACRCKVCDCEILDPTALVCNHEIVKNGMAPKMNCLYCDEHFYSAKLYNNHLALMHGHCFACGFICGDRSVLKDHIQSHLGHTEYACKFCKDIYQTSGNRRDHIRLKHPNHCCSQCNEWYVNQTDLTHHMRYAHADQRCQEKASICDTCGQSFKNKILFDRHIVTDHKQKRIYKCTTCALDFKFRYLLMDHLASVHNRTVVDNEVNFYKCCFCSKGFSSQHREGFITHIESHRTENSFCYDCNTNTESAHHLESHRERCHQDFSKSVGKLSSEAPSPVASKKPPAQRASSVNSKRPTTVAESANQQKQPSPATLVQTSSPKPMQFDFSSAVNVQPQQPPPTTAAAGGAGQQIVLQNEDGSLLNMNNLILTENGELIIQNLDGLLPNGSHDGDEGAQIQISNLEQFLMEQGLSGNAEISYIQPDMMNEDGQVIIQNNEAQQQQDSLMQTYKEIFESNDDEIPNELIGVGEAEQQSQNILLNGEYLIETPQQKPISNNIQHSIEHVDVSSSQQALDAANQSTLDELGDILLEVAAAAEKEKKPKVSEQKALRETLWGKKRNLEPVKEPSSKRRSGKLIEPVVENETPARDFSQAYEFFVRGFDAKKNKLI